MSASPLLDRLDCLCVSCRRRVRWDPDTRLEQLCDRCWRLLAPMVVEESETLL
ncbi:MAG TPA: hypothetical protein VHK89_01370 [Actinomycetota bacterium]|nr:hypothetical protein [Actinomycetota bacterium]